MPLVTKACLSEDQPVTSSTTFISRMYVGNSVIPGGRSIFAVPRYSKLGAPSISPVVGDVICMPPLSVRVAVHLTLWPVLFLVSVATVQGVVTVIVLQASKLRGRAKALLLKIPGLPIDTFNDEKKPPWIMKLS